MIERSIIEAIDALQIAYIRALDGKDMAGWLACFSPERSQYECITSESDEQGLMLPIMLDDNHARLKDRITYITEVWAGTFTDYATRHFIQRTTVQPLDDGIFRAETNVMVVYTTDRRTSEILAAGRYEDEIEVTGGKALFRKKRAVLDTVTTPRYLVYPI